MIRTLSALMFALLVITSVTVANDQNVLGELPDEFRVYAIGTYKGTLPLDIQLDDSGHTVTQVDVLVNKTDKPVVLVLTAYDPVVWRVGRTKNTKIAGVLVSGYHGQALIGIDKNTPHAISSHEEKGDFPYFYASRASRRLSQMNGTVKQLVGREIDQFDNKPTNGVFYIGNRPNVANVIFSKDLKIDGYIKPDRPLAGQPALAKLVQQKKLRLATKADIAAWVTKVSEKYQRFNPKIRFETHMQVGRTYVVLGKLTLPDGLYGGHSRDFIIPDEVPFPSGPRCHNSFYKMDGTSIGPGSHVD